MIRNYDVIVFKAGSFYVLNGAPYECVNDKPLSFKLLDLDKPQPPFIKFPEIPARASR